MGRRRQAREAALQALYLAEAGSMSANAAMLSVKYNSKLTDEAVAFAEELAFGAEKAIPSLDPLIQGIASNWALDRMAAVDRNLLRLAAYELLYYKDTPTSVVIDEALEIAKSYSSADSSKFLNGILDKIRSGAIKKPAKKKAKKKKAAKKTGA